MVSIVSGLIGVEVKHMTTRLVRASIEPPEAAEGP
jgi:hypothetical protein